MTKKVLSFIGTLLITTLLTGAIPFHFSTPSAQAGISSPTLRVAPEVRFALARVKEGEKIAVIVRFSEQAALQRLAGSRLEQQQRVVRTLQAQAERTQPEVLGRLAAFEASGKAADILPYWIFNGVSLKATPEVIEFLSRRPEVAQILPDRVFPAPQGAPAASQVVLNLDATQATYLWSLGYRGQGVVVANMDTGVSLNHPDLVAQWRGGSNSWFDPHGEHPLSPSDSNGHGTWTMGVMVGRSHSGTSIGIAPEARWIAVKIFNDQGYASSSAIHAGFQWLLDPDGDPSTDDAPHIVNNSWSFLSPGCYLDFQEGLRSLRAAGILPIFAAGNSGPGENSSVSPSNYPEAFSVGSIDNWGAISTTSSRGPAQCGGTRPYFPDIVAPGVGIYSTGLDGGYAYASGTSMAAPHVAGGLALLLSAFPGLTLAEQEAALRLSARDLGQIGPDDTYGHGALDLQAAYHLLAPITGVIPDTGQGSKNFIFLPSLFVMP
jgi:subtilisin family serine protease